ncbi:MAG: MazG family protein [Abditibacteriota bacterium]|nr:MazG family protein [Abditibacteriota bacterium]MBP5093963.1 MazG family protein [Abditibacteriota bacterium]
MDKKQDNFLKLIETVAALRAENGCPWDRVQTHMSLRACAAEEAYELIDAIEAGDDFKTCDELGDVLLQVLMHARIAEEEGKYDISDVCKAIDDKLRRRHPHVFGAVHVDGVEDVLTNWEEIKKTEKAHKDRHTILDSVPRHMPAMEAATKILKKMRKAGHETRTAEEIAGDMAETAAELAKTGDKKLLGKLLYEAAAVGRDLGADPADYFNMIVEASGVKEADK